MDEIRAKGKGVVKKVKKTEKPSETKPAKKKTKKDTPTYEKGQNVLVKVKISDESFWDGGKIKSVKPNGDLVVELYSGDKLTVPPHKVKKQKEKQKASLPKPVEDKLKRYVELMDRFEELSAELNEIRKEQDDIKNAIDNKLGREFEETREVLTDVKDRTIKILKYQRSSTPWKKMYSSLYDKVSKTLQATMDEMEEQLREVKDYIKISDETEAGVGDSLRKLKSAVLRGFNKLKGFFKNLISQGQDLRQVLEQMEQKPKVACVDAPIYEVCADLIFSGFDSLAEELICVASAKYKKGDRVVVDLKNEGVFLGTVTRAGTRIHVELDKGEKVNFAPNSKFIIGKAGKRQRKSAIPREQVNKYLMSPSTKFPDVHTTKPYPKKVSGPKQDFGRSFRTPVGRRVSIPQHLDSDYRGPMPNYGPRGLDNRGYDIWNEFYKKHHRSWEKPRYDIDARWGTAIQIFKRYARKYYDYAFALVEANTKKSAIDAIIENVTDRYRSSLTSEQQSALHSLVFEAMYKEVEVPSALKNPFDEVVQRLEPFLGKQHIRVAAEMSVEANELYLFIKNTEYLLNYLENIERTLQKHVNRKKYNHDAAIKAVLPLVNTAVRMYSNEFGEPNFTIPKSAKMEIAEELVTELEIENNWESVELEESRPFVDLDADPEELAEQFASMKRSELNKLFGKSKEGSSRVVWEINGYVVKRAKNKAGVEQNKRERDIYNMSYGKLRERLAPVRAISENDKVLIMDNAEKVRRLSKSFLEKMGYEEDVRVERNGRIFYEDVLTGPIWQQLGNWPDSGGVYVLERGGIGVCGDFLRPSSWGKLNGKLVLIDYGHTI